MRKSFQELQRTTNNHIAPHFNGIYVKDVTASDCQALLNKILAEGKGRISEDVKNLMTWIFETAVADKILLSNPMNSVQIPKHRRKNGKQILVDIMYAYLSNPPKDRYDYIIRFIAYTGIRPCEIAKFENGFVTIKNAKQKPNRGTHLQNYTDTFRPCHLHRRNKKISQYKSHGAWTSLQEKISA